MGRAVLVGGLCAAILVGLGVARGTALTAGVAHSERGPSAVSLGTSAPVASPSGTPSMDPDPSDFAPPGTLPRGSSRRADGLAAAPADAPAPVPATPAVAAEQAVAPRTADDRPADPVPKADSPAVASDFVRPGTYCARNAVGQTGYTSGATEMVCSDGDGANQPRWRAVGDVVKPTTVVPTTSKPPASNVPDPGIPS